MLLLVLSLTTVRGSGLGGGGGTNQLSVKILAICQLSVKFYAFCQLSVEWLLMTNYETYLYIFYAKFGLRGLRADISKYRPEVWKSEKSKILKKIHNVALGKLLK